MLRAFPPSRVGSARDQPYFRRCTVFLNEITIREVITGRYLEPTACRINKRPKPRRETYTTTPLIMMKKAQ